LAKSAEVAPDKNAQHSIMAAQAQAAQILDFLHTDLTLLTPRDKAGVLGLLRKTLLATQEHFLATTNRGITIFRDVSDLPRNRIYRVSGMGEVEADAGVSSAQLLPAGTSWCWC
jgi:hypothetical protein